MKNIFLLLSLFIIISSCNEGTVIDPIDGSYIRMLPKGTNSFLFKAYKPLVNKPVNIFYHIPAGIDMETALIVMVFHGMSRNADDYRDYWISSADKYGFMIFCPEFTKELYPSDSDSNSQYNFGNMITSGNLNPKEVWTFSIVNPIFDRIKLATGNESESFYMFGHSAGSQFVHRCLTFLPEVKAKKAVAANAGWYTMPDFDVVYPYGLEASFLHSDSLPQLFEREIIVLLGTADTLRTPSLRQSALADDQGLNRFERGLYYFNLSSSYASENGLVFNWSIMDVPDVGHTGSAMSVAAANFLFGEIGK